MPPSPVADQLRAPFGDRVHRGLYGDKNGLLDAVVSFAPQGYVEEKRLLADNPSDDPGDDLRRLWDLHVEFGMMQPDCYVLAYGPSRPEHTLSAAAETIRILTDVIARLADQGDFT